MPFITFFYRIAGGTYFGKYECKSISDDHEGLDLVVHKALLEGLNNYRKSRGYRPLRRFEVRVGIISQSDEYCSQYDSKAFDFYCDSDTDKVYLNGRLVKMQEAEAN